MNPKNDRTESGQSRPALPPPQRRFRIQKLEERIAPKKGGGGPTKNCSFTGPGPGGCSS